MMLIRSSDEMREAQIQLLLERLEFADEFVGIVFWRKAFLGRLLIDLKAVLICSGIEKDIVTLHPLMPRDYIRLDDFQCKTDMRIGI